MAEKKGLSRAGARRIRIFDTTLRDGTQGEHVALSCEDKLRIARRLDTLGIDYIEGGWPGSNPKDMQFFRRVKEDRFSHARIVAFGSTRRAGNAVEDDPNIRALLEAGTPVVAVFGKSWLLHVRNALRIEPEENLELIEDSVRYLQSRGKEVLFDAEHFFDGYEDNPEYALSVLKAAADAGAHALVLCDTNGGMLPGRVGEVVEAVAGRLDTPLGIHAHNDGDMAVANTVTAVEAGCVHVQGTVNGYGERCGNANLCSVIPNLQIKKGFACIPAEKLRQLTTLSRFVSEVANMHLPTNMPFVGKSAFAHKGGIHVSAIMRDRRTYEHIEPERVGNAQRVLVSDLSGRSNVLYKAEELSIDLGGQEECVPVILEKIKLLESEGYQFEAAEASFELLVKRLTGEWDAFFSLEGLRVSIEKNFTDLPRAEASIRVRVNDETEHTAAEGVGPVHALDRALRKALVAFYPEVEQMQLRDYKVRVLNASDATRARVRVLIESATDDAAWSTVGVSENIIEASWQALEDSFSFYLHQTKNGDHHETVRADTGRGDVFSRTV